MTSIYQSVLAVFGLTALSGAVLLAAAYGALRWFGEKWISSKFTEKLEIFKHAQQREIEQLKFQISASMDRAAKLHQREFETLPEAWSTLVTAYHSVKGITAAFQSYPDISRMRDSELDEFLEGCEFSKSQREDIKNSDDRNKAYQETYYWHRFNSVQADVRNHHVFLMKNAIFMPTGMKAKFLAIGDLAWEALTEQRIAREMKDWRHRDKVEKLSKEGDAMLLSLEDDVQKRLWSDVQT